MLGIRPTSSEAEIRAAWRSAVKGSHPDLHPGDTTAASRFADAQQAFQVLMSEPARRPQGAGFGFAQTASTASPDARYSMAQNAAYAVLDIEPGASQAAIDAAYLKQVNRAGHDLDFLHVAYSILSGDTMPPEPPPPSRAAKTVGALGLVAGVISVVLGLPGALLRSRLLIPALLMAYAIYVGATSYTIPNPDGGSGQCRVMTLVVVHFWTCH